MKRKEMINELIKLGCWNFDENSSTGHLRSLLAIINKRITKMEFQK